MIHRPKSIKGLIDRIEVMAKLYEAWNDLTRLESKTLRIYKEDWGMDRFRETLIYRTTKHISKMKPLIEQVLELFKKDIEAII